MEKGVLRAKTAPIPVNERQEETVLYIWVETEGIIQAYYLRLPTANTPNKLFLAVAASEMGDKVEFEIDEEADFGNKITHNFIGRPIGYLKNSDKLYL